jgi:large subunit ribosomal protein L5
MLPRILQKIEKEVKPKLVAEFGLGNPNRAPRVRKITLNVGIRSDLKDAKVIDEYIKDLAAISGQHPVKTLAKQSISSFKIRQGQTVGLVVTLRGKRMYEFLDKLLNVSLARIRDFRGLDEKGFDRNGNFSIGFHDQISFPEISADSVAHLFGLQVTLTIDAPSREQAVAFLKLLGLPIKKSGK